MKNNRRVMVDEKVARHLANKITESSQGSQFKSCAWMSKLLNTILP